QTELAGEAVTEAKVLAGDDLMKDPLTVERLGLVAELLEDEQARFLLEQAADGYNTAGDRVSATRAAIQAARLAAKKDDPTALMRLEDKAAVLADAEPLAMLRRYQAEAQYLKHDHQGCAKKATDAVALADTRGLHRVAKLARMIAARCADRTGQLEEAVRLAREGCSMVELELRHVTGDIARQQLGFEAFIFYRVLLSLEAKRSAADRVNRAFVVSERARARAHLDAVARSQLGHLPLPVSPTLEQDRAQAEQRVRRFTQKLLKVRSRAVADLHDKSLAAVAELKDSMLRQNPLMSRITPPEPADIETVRKTLVDDDTVLLSYFMTDERVYLFTIDRAQASLDTLEEPAEDLDRAVRSFHSKYLLAAGSNPKGAAKALFKKLLGPVADRVAKKKRWIVVPHGPMSLLPFESLVDQSDRYVVESHEVVYSVSATLGVALAKRKESSADRHAFVGMGDPVYDWAAFSGGKTEGKGAVATRALELWTAAEEAAGDSARGLERLPATAQEVRDIARLFGADQKVYLRDQATEEVVKGGAFSGYRIVHVASHGLMGPHYQALALSLRPDAKEDGFLMNNEIAELDLDADLVVLSACRTGDTARNLAEPIAGLALSLRGAGARRVVLSLWSVADDATADLMREFYKPLVKEGVDYAASLAQAKRRMLASDKWSHPFYWAAFVLHGS
ncbi:MAG TPA: CHAT domain-containing protein, partial [Polyangiaceae bacterium]|nr:CHAT domain-containing protein [Polyangiaceae bacterium]